MGSGKRWLRRVLLVLLSFLLILSTIIAIVWPLVSSAPLESSTVVTWMGIIIGLIVVAIWSPSENPPVPPRNPQARLRRRTVIPRKNPLPPRKSIVLDNRIIAMVASYDRGDLPSNQNVSQCERGVKLLKLMPVKRPKIIVDDERVILNEYLAHRGSPVIREWLKEFSGSDMMKLGSSYSGQIPIALDLWSERLLRICLMSDDAILITEDNTLLGARSQPWCKNKRFRIMSIREALAEL